MFRKKLKIASKYVEQAHEFFDLKEYREAIDWYNKGLAELELPINEIKILRYDKNYLEIIDLYQSIWGWLANAHKELGEEMRAIKCIEKQQSYGRLQELFAKNRREYLREKAKNRRNDRRYLLWVAAFHVLLLVSGMMVCYLLLGNAFYINLIIFPIYFVIYLFFVNDVRNLFFIKEEYKSKSFPFHRSRVWSKKLSLTDRKYIDKLERNMFIVGVLVTTLVFMLLSWLITRDPYPVPIRPNVILYMELIFHVIVICLNYSSIIAEFNLLSTHFAYQRKDVIIIKGIKFLRQK